MYESILEFFLSRPSRLVALGRALFSGAGFVIVVGLICRVATVSVGVIRSLGAAAPQPTTLDALYPNMTMWWIPETGFGYVLATVMAIAGILIARTGRKLERFIRH